MTIIDSLLKEMDQEAATTARWQRIPDDRFDLETHEKSMAIRQLLTHLAELPTCWVSLALDTLELVLKPALRTEATGQRPESWSIFEHVCSRGCLRLFLARLPTWNRTGRSERQPGDSSVTTRGETIRMALPDCTTGPQLGSTSAYCRTSPFQGKVYGPAPMNPDSDF